MNKKKQNTYTRTPVTTEAIKVPRMAKVTIAPKLEKKGFCENGGDKINRTRDARQKENKQLSQRYHICRAKSNGKLTGERLKPD